MSCIRMRDTGKMSWKCGWTRNLFGCVLNKNDGCALNKTDFRMCSFHWFVRVRGTYGMKHHVCLLLERGQPRKDVNTTFAVSWKGTWKLGTIGTSYNENMETKCLLATWKKQPRMMSTKLCCEMERNVKVGELFMLESDGRLCYEDNSWNQLLKINEEMLR